MKKNNHKKIGIITACILLNAQDIAAMSQISSSTKAPTTDRNYTELGPCASTGIDPALSFSLLSDTIQNGAPKQLETLLQEARQDSADVGMLRDKHGMNILMDAAGKGKIGHLTTLLDTPHLTEDQKNKLKNGQDYKGNTVLMYAMFAADTIAHSLTQTLAQPRNIALQNKEGYSALSYAAQKNKLATATKLIKLYANRQYTDQQGKKVYIVAQQDDKGRTPFMIALEHKNHTLAHRILNHTALSERERKAVASTPTNTNKTPSMEAAAQGNGALMRQIIHLSSNIALGTIDSKGHDLLDYALQSNQWAIIQQLEKEYCYVSQHGHKHLVRSIHAISRYPYPTSYHYQDTLHRVRHLVRNGASSQSRTVDGSTPLEHAHTTKNPDLMRILVPARL